MAPEALVNASTGVMDSVIEKLLTLMGEEYKKYKNMQREVAFLKDELGSMNAVLKKLANMEEELDPQTVEWRNQVMDTSFDMEDCIDDFMHEVSESANIGDVGLVGKILKYIQDLRNSYHFANQIQQLKTRLNDVSERRKRYKLDEGASSSSYVDVDPRVHALYAEAANLVGMEGPKEEVNMLLAAEEGASVQHLRVVSIVGFGGLGKTTLANQVYHEIGEQYNCKAFVSVSQRPDMMKLLSGIITKVGMPQPTHTCEVQDLIDKIREYLRDKRYLFVIDDIWDESLWGVIRCAFPENQKGSKVITTTRINTVANASCNNQHEFVYKMRPLDDQNSRKLFFSRVGQVCTQPFEKISDEILKRCGGLPLAIISIASLLVSQPTRSMEQWTYVCNSLSSNLRLNPTLEGMRQVLKLSYNNLPHHLKACMLYIAMYPEDYEIKKENLMKQWVAEGFIGKVHGRDGEELAGSYFNDLINRSMIQPTDIRFNGEVRYCKVHDMVLDLIRLQSKEEKFLSVVDNVQSMKTTLESKVRRLSFHFFYGGNEDTTSSSLSMSHIRSLALFGKSPFKFPMSELRSIRVMKLDFRGAGKVDTIDLTPICRLFQLRYLSIRGIKAQLPTLIGGLQCLETLELYDDTSAMPLDIVDLPCLLHLRVPTGTRMPEGICRMKSLHTLHNFDVDLNSVNNIQGVGELINLRILLFCCQHTVDQGGIMDVFWSSVAKLISCNLRSLYWNYLAASKINPRLVELDSPSTCHTRSNLEVLHTAAGLMFPRVPIWTGQLQKLYKLGITVEKLMQEDVDLLAGLPNLAFLWLWIQKSPEERIVIRDNVVAFQLLQYLRITCFAPCLTFMAGTMPKLQELKLQIHERGVERHGSSTLEGVEHLPSLRQVDVDIHLEATESERRAVDAEAILSNAINLHPGHPTIGIRLLDNRTCPLKICEDPSDGSDGDREMERRPNVAVDQSVTAD